MRFHTDFKYKDREDKAKYVYLKYKSVLRGSILDVGADACYLREHLPEDVSYVGIGLGGAPDQEVDLEEGKIPFLDDTFDCVLCCDVLEHLDNIHEVFDELCRVSRQYVIISLPNPWASFWNMICYGEYRPGTPLKFYGLPPEKPEDRHKWFFGYREAVEFVKYRVDRNNFSILQLDHEGVTTLQLSFATKMMFKRLFVKDFDLGNLYYGTLWAVLEKNG